jgi:hypothetical protein
MSARDVLCLAFDFLAFADTLDRHDALAFRQAEHNHALGRTSGLADLGYGDADGLT